MNLHADIRELHIAILLFAELAQGPGHEGQEACVKAWLARYMKCKAGPAFPCQRMKGRWVWLKNLVLKWEGSFIKRGRFVPVCGLRSVARCPGLLTFGRGGPSCPSELRGKSVRLECLEGLVLGRPRLSKTVEPID